MAILDRGFKELPALSEAQDKVYAVSAKVANELALMAILSPTMCTNVAAGFTDRLIALCVKLS